MTSHLRSLYKIIQPVEKPTAKQRMQV